MAEFLSRLRPAELVSAIGTKRLQSLAALTGATDFQSDPELVGRLAVALLGKDLLAEARVRRLLFRTLGQDVLASMAERYAKKRYPKPADNAIALSRLPWASGSAFVTEAAHHLELPPDFLPQIAQTPPTVERVGPPPTYHPLRPYQRTVADRVRDHLRENTERLLVQLPTGAGKTRTIVDALHTYGPRGTEAPFVLWVAHTEELCEQALETFRAVWSGKSGEPLTLVRSWGSHRPSSEQALNAAVFTTYQKLAALLRSKDPLFDGFANSPRVVVVDEAHKVLAPSFKAVIEALLAQGGTALIGLTATPGRGVEHDQENRRLAEFFDRELVEPDESPLGLFADLQSAGILSAVSHSEIRSSEVVALSGDEIREVSGAFDLPTRVLARLAVSQPRNAAILDAILEHSALGRAALVFACSVEHSRLLTAALQVRGCASAHLDSTMSKAARRAAIADFGTGKVQVLLNYEILSTGFDAPRVDTVVIARPTTSLVLYSQMVGRGLRGPASGGSATCYLVDVRDNFGAFGDVDRVYRAFDAYWHT